MIVREYEYRVLIQWPEHPGRNDVKLVAKSEAEANSYVERLMLDRSVREHAIVKKQRRPSEAWEDVL